MRPTPLFLAVVLLLAAAPAFARDYKVGAIDVATAAKRLGAEQVTIAYRRGEDAMPAFAYEYELAKGDAVRFEWFAQPVRVALTGGTTSPGIFEMMLVLGKERTLARIDRVLTGA